jgi:hypothetical protein
VAPVVAILLLGLALFAIAATIVLSLIALYLPSRNVNTASTTSGQETRTFPLSSGSTTTTGAVNSAGLSSLQSQVRFNIK